MKARFIPQNTFVNHFPYDPKFQAAHEKTIP